MKNLIISAFALSIALLSSSCNMSNEPSYEYKVEEFQREQSSDFEYRLNQLANEGWNYTGELTANGINGRYIVFKKRK
jgi:hypothetical protein